MSLRAPIAIPVEIRAETGRAFRLAAAIGEDGMRLETPLPFEGGRVVEVRFTLPDGARVSLPARLDG
ncbi:MAG: PilZ domain-containing protein, partial [Pseudomonadota bacterium]